MDAEVQEIEIVPGDTGVIDVGAIALDETEAAVEAATDTIVAEVVRALTAVRGVDIVVTDGPSDPDPLSEMLAGSSEPVFRRLANERGLPLSYHPQGDLA